MRVKDSDMNGRKFGMLTVVRRGHQNYEKRWFWECQCECGEVVNISKSKLDSGKKNCGHPRHGGKHGMHGTRIYSIWRSMKKRTGDRSHVAYPRYSSAGITVCEKWQRFDGFYEDMGDPPSESHELDRIDNTRGYFKSNCRWATRSQNARNKSTSKIWIIKGVRFPTLKTAANAFGVDPTTISNWCRGSYREDCHVEDVYK